MLVKEAKALGNISLGNTKMPGTTFAIDAFACKTGDKLAKIKGTPCHACYARKLQKLRPSVDKGWKANLAKWQAAKPDQWAQALAFQIIRYNADGFHRWFDAGDLQSVEMLSAIVDVCHMTPNVRHWLPTQERGIVAEFMANGGVIPDNLVIRVSGSKVNGPAPRFANTSTVFDKTGQPIGKECKARSRGNQCGPCRACWDKTVSNISYPKH